MCIRDSPSFPQSCSNILTRERMLEQLWGNDGCFINDHTLTVVINRLRTKLEGKDKAYIQTIRGIGYAWNEKQS